MVCTQFKVVSLVNGRIRSGGHNSLLLSYFLPLTQIQSIYPIGK